MSARTTLGAEKSAARNSSDTRWFIVIVSFRELFATSRSERGAARMPSSRTAARPRVFERPPVIWSVDDGFQRRSHADDVDVAVVGPAHAAGENGAEIDGFLEAGIRWRKQQEK